MRLDALLAGVAEAEVLTPGGGGGDTDAGATEVTAVVHDTRAVTPGALFCCVRGERIDGHDLAPEAVAGGAVALLAERAVDVLVPQVVVPSVRAAMGPVAAAFWDHPSAHLAVVGVTGTSGKTTTTHLLGAVGEAGGLSTEVIGTLSGPRTTPEAPELQAQLAIARASGRRAVAMEVSSHALSLGRVHGVRFSVAVFTNLSHDHLDFHEDLESYFAAKASLFEPDLADAAVVNLDDPYGVRLAEHAAVPTEGYSLADAEHLEVGPQRSRFTWRGQAVELPLGGRFNVANALAAATAAAHLGIDLAAIADGLAAVPPVPGRFEVVDEGQPFTVLVDYSHKPGALGSALTAAREAAGSGRLLLVFGAGGSRDASKRPEMGEVAGRLADRVLLTSDNPRGEDPLAIIDAVRSGMVRTDGLTVEPDRRAAIARAVAEAKPGDVVLIAGKGHETVQVVGDESVPFDDRVEARDALPRPARGGGVVALLLAASLAIAASLVGTKLLIDWLISRQVGQPIHEDVPRGHTVKAGTPTMGGLAIVGAAVIGYLAAHVRSGLVFTRTGVLVMGCIAGAGGVGLIDDWIKVRNERNLGLSKRAKTAGLLTVALAFAIATVLWTDVETTLSFTRFDSPGIGLGSGGWCVWAVLLIYATANGVNLSDGLDGLAAGSSIFVFSCLMVIGFWAFRHSDFYEINHALDIAVVAAAMLGASAGFLWWNAAPARIFMGDTGSLAIGAGVAAMVLTLNVQLLLPIAGALYVTEVLSVILQVGSFRLFKRRIFRMAPIHHHFELGGWPETTVIIRFWMLSGMCTALALGIFYADWIGTGGLD